MIRQGSIHDLGSSLHLAYRTQLRGPGIHRAISSVAIAPCRQDARDASGMGWMRDCDEDDEPEGFNEDDEGSKGKGFYNESGEGSKGEGFKGKGFCDEADEGSFKGKGFCDEDDEGSKGKPRFYKGKGKFYEGGFYNDSGKGYKDTKRGQDDEVNCNCCKRRRRE